MERRCLDHDELQLVLCGRLGSDEFESAVSHLDQCEKCRQSAESLEQDRPWIVESLSGADDPLHIETECQIALWQVLGSVAANPGVTQPVQTALPLQELGPYQLKYALGSGGMGTVYLAEHMRLQRPCAIKILPRERVDQPGWLERFDREMTTIASLEHANVVRASDAGHEDGWHYLVMEYLDGLDVGRIAGRMGQLDVADACEIVRQAALGLAHIHAAGLVHRDIKPSNVMLTRTGDVKLLDLGLVLSGDDPLSISDRLTTVGHLMGTMPYMAPEQLRDSHDVTASADIYSLGATLYRLIAGKPPHGRHGGLANQVMAITEEDALPLDAIREDVDKELVELTKRLLSRDPSLRPASATEVAIALETFGGGRLRRLLRHAAQKPEQESSVPSTQFLHSSAPQPVAPWKRWRPYLLTLMVALGFVLAGTSIVIFTDRGELTIFSDQEDVSISIHQGKRVVEQLQIRKGDDQRITLRKGSYRIQIDNAPGLSLSDDVVTIQRGSTQRIDVRGGTAARLYKGKGLSEWMTQLEREEDPISLGGIINAVEVLTRDTPMRTKAADATMETARLWGGFSSSSPNPGPNGMVSNNPSQHYMFFLNDTFPRYGAQGLHAIDRELQHGNEASRLASLWMLANLYQGGMPIPEDMLDHLELAIEAVEKTGAQHTTAATELGRKVAVQIATDSGQAMAGEWLEDYARRKINEATRQWKDPSLSQQGFGGIEPWLVNESMLLAAVSLAESDELELDWEWLAHVLTHADYQWQSDRSNELLELVATHAGPTLQQLIAMTIDSMETPVVGSYGAFSVRTKNTFWSSDWIPAFALGTEQSIWPKALLMYAQDAERPAEAIEKLSRLKQVMISNGADPKHSSDPMQWINSAISHLKNRVSLSAKPSAQRKVSDGDHPDL